ncbi:MAG: hypothetical protein QOH48_1740 [Actinomycetota bacterium]|nr:hypothetical protein [Actinomycetota bacterium]
MTNSTQIPRRRRGLSPAGVRRETISKLGGAVASDCEHQSPGPILWLLADVLARPRRTLRRVQRRGSPRPEPSRSTALQR